MDLVKSCPGFVSKDELFHRHGIGTHLPIEYEKLKNISGGAVTDGESFRTWRHTHPAETLEALHGAWEPQIVAFKLFPYHLPEELIESEIFARKDVAFAVLRRRPIESYISTVKAKSVGVFKKVDTTEMKPELSAENFMVWARRMRTWFTWVRRSLEARNEPFARISFERHVHGLSGEESLGLILDLLRPLGFDHIGMPGEIIEGERQDREPDYRNRVANWDAFAAELRASPQSAKMLKWAERIVEN